MAYKIDAEKCVGCGLCKDNCPVEAIEASRGLERNEQRHRIARIPLHPQGKEFPHRRDRLATGHKRPPLLQTLRRTHPVTRNAGTRFPPCGRGVIVVH